jgi:hypothetical protein
MFPFGQMACEQAIGTVVNQAAPHHDILPFLNMNCSSTRTVFSGVSVSIGIVKTGPGRLYIQIFNDHIGWDVRVTVTGVIADFDHGPCFVQIVKPRRCG